jgi:hypothetical protein
MELNSMQQAEEADSTAAPGASAGKIDEISGRRAFLKAALIAPAAAAFAAAPAQAMPGETTQAEIDGGRAIYALFAEVWLDQWCHEGGVVMLDMERNEIDIWMPDYSLSRAYDRDLELRAAWPKLLTEKQARERDEEMGWYYCGRMRALTDLLKLFPGGRLAVKLAVAGRPNGRAA